MKILRFAPLIIGLATPVQAKDTCTFTSEYQPEVTIELNAKQGSGAMGLMKYRGSPILNFSTGITNGYSSQRFVISISRAPNEKNEIIAKGEVVTVVGDQPGRKGIPIEKRKKGQMKLFFPGFGTGYFYSLDVTEAGGRFGSRSKQKTAVLKAAEGFWIPSKKCEKYVYYGW